MRLGLGLGRRLPGPRLEHLVGRFAVDGLLVVAEDDRALDDRLPLRRRHRSDAAPGRQDEGPLDDPGLALLVEEGDQGLAGAELGDLRLDVDLGILAEGLGRRPDRLLVPRREGPQGVLDAVAELAEDDVGDVEGVLGDEVDRRRPWTG